MRRARAVALGGLVASAALTAALAVPLRQSIAILAVAWGVVAVCVAAAALVPRAARAPFPLLALGSAALAVGWLAALPV
jgi:hypothetical protein